MKGYKTADEWDFKGCNTQYGVHGLHTYVAAMIPQLARRLVSSYSRANGVVLDPFCGGGAVLAEASSSGRDAIGRDVNPLAVLISRAKTTYVEEQVMTQTLTHLLETIDFEIETPVLPPGLLYWFKPEHLIPIQALRNAIKLCVDDDSKAFSLFLTVFSATVRDVSLTYRNEIRLRRMSDNEIERMCIDPIERFRTRLIRAAKVVSNIECESSVQIRQCTAEELDLEDDIATTTICSPPYGDERNGVSYSQFAKNMLSWLGYEDKEIKAAKRQSLGWGNTERERPCSSTLDRAISNIEAFPQSIDEATAFYADYQVTLREITRVTNGPIVIVIGQRVLRDTVFDNGAITIDLMRNIGVDIKETFVRNLPTKRLPKMRKFGAAINKEHILVFHK